MARHMIRSTWSAPRRPNHQRKLLDIKVHQKSFKLSSKLMLNPSKIFPIFFQNPFKIRQKSIQNPLKSIQHRSQNRKKTQMRSQSVPKAIFSIFYWFLEGWGPPKMASKPQKSEKKGKKIDVQKKHVFEHDFSLIFRGFGLSKSIQNRRFFEHFLKTSILRKFAKTIEKHMVFIDFSCFQHPEIY